MRVFYFKRMPSHYLWIPFLVFLTYCPNASSQGQLFSTRSPVFEGNSHQTMPFTERRWQLQQVHAASDFVRNGHTEFYITHLVFPSNGGTAAVSHSIESFQAYLSVTAVAPDSLSPVFNDNVGAARQLVFDGPLDFNSTVGFELSQPYYYDATQGNLLLDLRNLSGSRPTNAIHYFDAHEVVGDSVSSVYGLVGAEGGITTTVGLVVVFQGYLVPEPRVPLIGAVMVVLLVLTVRKGKNVST